MLQRSLPIFWLGLMFAEQLHGGTLKKESNPELSGYELGRSLARPLKADREFLIVKLEGVGEVKEHPEDMETTLRKLNVKVEKVLSGLSFKLGDSIGLNALQYSKGARITESFRRVWNNNFHKLKKGDRLLIAQLSNKEKPEEYLALPQTVALVLADERAFERAAKVIAWHQMHKGSAQQLARSLVAMKGQANLQDPLLVGYTVGYLLPWDPEIAVEIEDRSSGLAALLNLDPVANDDRIAMAMEIASSFKLLGKEAQTRAIRELIGASSREGVAGQRIVYRLGYVCHNHQVDLQPFLEGELKKKLWANYKKAVAPRADGSRGWDPIPALEKQLKDPDQKSDDLDVSFSQVPVYVGENFKASLKATVEPTGAVITFDTENASIATVQWKAPALTVEGIKLGFTRIRAKNAKGLVFKVLTVKVVKCTLGPSPLFLAKDRASLVGMYTSPFDVPGITYEMEDPGVAGVEGKDPILTVTGKVAGKSTKLRVKKGDAILATADVKVFTLDRIDAFLASTQTLFSTTNAKTDFHPKNGEDLLVVVKDAGDVAVSLKGTGDLAGALAAGALRFQVGLNPQNLLSVGLFPFKDEGGGRFTLKPDRIGSFRITFYHDANANGHHEAGEELRVVCVAVIPPTAPAPEKPKPPDATESPKALKDLPHASPPTRETRPAQPTRNDEEPPSKETGTAGTGLSPWQTTTLAVIGILFAGTIGLLVFNVRRNRKGE